MNRFTGRAKEIVTIPTKPTPTGLKIWVIAQLGFIIAWCFHRPGSKGGPVGVKTPVELGGNKHGNGGNKTQAVVVHLLEQLLPSPANTGYHVFIDNLFTSTILLELLRERGFAATGTCRTTAGVVQELVDLKAKSKTKPEPWGTKHLVPTEANTIMQVGWQDSAFALTMSTLFDGITEIPSLRRRPRETSSARVARKPFGNQSTKVMLILELYDAYNHGMGAVDEADQLQASLSGLRRVRRGAHQALEHWLFLSVLVNCYVIAKNSDYELFYRSQSSFRTRIFEGLVSLGRDGGVPRKRSFGHTKQEADEVPPYLCD